MALDGGFVGHLLVALVCTYSQFSARKAVQCGENPLIEPDGLHTTYHALKPLPRSPLLLPHAITDIFSFSSATYM